VNGRLKQCIYVIRLFTSFIVRVIEDRHMKWGWYLFVVRGYRDA